MIKKRGIGKIRGLATYLTSSLALAGALLYSNLAKAQEQPKEEQKQEQPQKPKEDDIEIKTAPKEPQNSLVWHIKGGASPNEDSQASRNFSDINFSLKDKFTFDLFTALSSQSYTDLNGIRTLNYSPLNVKADAYADLGKGFSTRLGFNQSLEETIRRINSQTSTVVGTSQIDVSTRTKTIDILEHYGGLLEFSAKGVVFSLRPYSERFPTIVTHNIRQKVTDPNPSASFESAAYFRDPTPRNKRQGLLFRAGHTEYLTGNTTLVTDLLGIAEQELIKIEGLKDREIQRVYVGVDIYADSRFFSPRVALLKGFLDDRSDPEDYQHAPNATKLFASVYFNAKEIELKRKKLKSEKPGEERTEVTNLPVLAGASYSLDKQYGAADDFTKHIIRAVLGFGNVSGKDALLAIASVQDDLALKELGLRPEEGKTLSRLHGEWQSYKLPFGLASKKSLGLLLTARYSLEDLEARKESSAEARAHLLLGPVIISGNTGYNTFLNERSFGAGINYSVEDWLLLGADYLESKQNRERFGTYSAGVRVKLK